jgi:hypothetical protein
MCSKIRYGKSIWSHWMVVSSCHDETDGFLWALVTMIMRWNSIIFSSSECLFLWAIQPIARYPVRWSYIPVLILALCWRFFTFAEKYRTSTPFTRHTSGNSCSLISHLMFADDSILLTQANERGATRLMQIFTIGNQSFFGSFNYFRWFGR